MTKIQDIEPKGIQVVVRKESNLITPEALEREEETRKLIKGYISKNLKKGTDYYELTIGGRKSKPSLSKSGAEKFMSLFHLRAEFGKDEDTWSMAGSKAGMICYVCKLYTKSGQLVGEGRGARDMAKDNGDLNKSIKMSQKSANIDAVLRVGALSDVFTLDLEDMKEVAQEIPTVQLDTKFTEEQHKLTITKLLAALKIKPKSKEESEKYIKDLTQLELSPENYEEIISRLRVVYNESKNQK